MVANEQGHLKEFGGPKQNRHEGNCFFTDEHGAELAHRLSRNESCWFGPENIPVKPQGSPRISPHRQHVSIVAYINYQGGFRSRDLHATCYIIFIHLADTFIQSDLQLLYMSEVARLWSN